MRHSIYISLLFFLVPFVGHTQFEDFLGAGHIDGVTVTASDSEGAATPDKSFDGSGMNAKYFEAARFLSQATMGHTDQMVNDLVASDLDFEGWIDNQLNMPPTHLTPVMTSIWDTIFQFIDIYENAEDIFGPWSVHFNYAYWQVMMTNDNDLLRHKMANALTQIFVVSENSDLGSWAEAMTGYYDMMLDDAFGNYRDLLYDVTMSIQMGYYLSHFNNSRHFPDENTFPDENYAREIMQLFSIGLYELNNDGTRKTDANGNYIPTYDNDDIQEFAKIFTGLGMSELEDPTQWPFTPQFGVGIWAAKKDKPMKMYQTFHEPGPKYLLNNLVVPANQPGLTDINMAIDNLFNHPNVGPFIARRLIQRFVKSNPTPQYIDRIASVFNDNGNGVRGDLGAVVKAILLDSEARSAEGMMAPHAGRAKEPLQKISAFAKIMPKIAPTGRFWANGYDYLENTGQHILASPTVFNFYMPDYKPIGPLDDAGMTAPELKLHNTSTAIKWVNQAFSMNEWGAYLMYDWEGATDSTTNEWIEFDTTYVSVDYDQFLSYSENPEVYVNLLDKYMTYGQLSDATRKKIVDGLRQIYWTWDEDWKRRRLINGMYFMLISPDYNTLR